MTPGEFYTAQFYAWEYRGRGWHVSEEPVQLEPPYIPFFRHGYAKAQIDDGKRHTPISKLIENLKGGKKEILIESTALDYEMLEQFPYETDGDLAAIQIKLPKERKVSVEKMKALLLMLSGTNRPLSFEIIGTETAICIQFVCSEWETDTITTYIQAYFPECVIRKSDAHLDIFQPQLSTFVVDFGLRHEFVRPIQTAKNFSLDPLTGLFGILERLTKQEQAGIQVLFQPTLNNWKESMIRSVSMLDGTSFFIDVPEAPELAREKTQSPLYATSIRAFAQAEDLGQAEALLQRISTAIVSGSKGLSNELIPLSNPDYDFETRANDILYRESHRLGMLINRDELLTFLHFPSENIQSKKLYGSTRKTKETPTIAKDKAFVLGENMHDGEREIVSIGIEERLKHIHIIGATGTGKSTLISNLVLQDISKGLGAVVFDPHGDLVDDIICRIPENRLKDVVLVDPADTEYPIGLNILEAKTDIEKEVLSSDLVASFRKHATSWGDQMNTVLGNCILAILESTEGGTLHDVRRFLIEKEYRNRFLKNISDPSVQYYWQREFPLLKTNSIGPILTRLDSFLRPKSVRNMLAQKEGLDFETLLNTQKILLLKLSQGLIGIENSYLLGSLLLSKLHSAILKRQRDTNRSPVFLYLDEFQHFITPSVKDMISGIRKYHVGLTLSHQDLQQLQREDGELLHSVLGNIHNRIVFRVGEPDAKRLQEGFSDFDSTDLQNLGRGEAIVRIEQPKYDCSIETIPPKEKHEAGETNRTIIIEHTRAHYAKSKSEVEKILLTSLNLDLPTTPEKEEVTIKATPEVQEEKIAIPTTEVPENILPKKKTAAPVQEQQNLSTHKYLQQLVKKMAEARGYVAVLETQIPGGGGQVDVLLTKDNKTIAIEICVSTDADWEMHNIQKCIQAKYDEVISLCGDPRQLEKIRKKGVETIPDFETKPVQFLTPDALFTYLDTTVKDTMPEAQLIKGYRVNVSYDEINKEDMDRKRATVAKVVMESLRKIKKKG